MLTTLGLNYYRLMFGGGGTCNADNSGDTFSAVTIDGQTGYVQNQEMPRCTSNSSSTQKKLRFGSDAQITRGMTTLSNMSGAFEVASAGGKPTLTDSGNISTQSFTIPNNTSEAITYTCFGLTVSAGYPLNKEVLVSVFMLEAPVTIPAGEARSIEIKFDYSDL